MYLSIFFCAFSAILAPFLLILLKLSIAFLALSASIAIFAKTLIIAMLVIPNNAIFKSLVEVTILRIAVDVFIP